MISMVLYLLGGTIILIGLALALDSWIYQTVRFSETQPIATSKFSLPELIMVLTVATDTNPSLKRVIAFKIPYRFRIDESAEVRVAYYEAVTLRLLSGGSSFIHEKIGSIFRHNTDGLRGKIVYPLPGQLSRASHLPTDIGLTLSSTKVSIAPSGWVVRKTGEKIPCQWRWSLSSDTLGKYHLVFEVDAGLRKLIENDQLSKPILFEVEVRSPYGLTLKQLDFMRSAIRFIAIIIGALFTLALTLLAFPSIQTYLSSFIPR
jgi:hypothetical protein